MGLRDTRKEGLVQNRKGGSRVRWQEARIHPGEWQRGRRAEVPGRKEPSAGFDWVGTEAMRDHSFLIYIR